MAEAPSGVALSPPEMVDQAGQSTEQPALEISAEPSQYAIETSQRAESPTPASSPGAPVVKRGDKKRHAAPHPLVIWDSAALKSGGDPLGKGLAILMEKGAHGSVFLATQDPPPGSPVPHFLATAAIATSEKIQLWTDLRWDPTLVPDVWNSLVQNGYVELSPPGTSTNVRSTRNIVRNGFGIAKEEWILLVRIGTPKICRGILLVVSQKSLQPALAPLLTLFHSVPSAA